MSSEGHRGHLLPAVAVFDRAIGLGLTAYSRQDFMGRVLMRMHSRIQLVHVSYATEGSHYFSLMFIP